MTKGMAMGRSPRSSRADIAGPVERRPETILRESLSGFSRLSASRSLSRYSTMLGWCCGSSMFLLGQCPDASLLFEESVMSSVG